MAALSDYLESGLLSHLFKNDAFTRPSTIAIALTSGVPLESDTGSSILEIPSGVVRGSSFVTTNYSRINLGDPATNGNNVWHNVGVDETTAYEVYSEEVDHSGYFYPLYLSESTAISEDGETGLSQSYTFSNTFPSVTFYGPSTVTVSGSQTSGGYTLYEGNGFIKNKDQIVFNTALTDWGWVSGVAIVDHATHGSGNLLMYAQLENPRFVYAGDSIKFDTNSLEISLK